MFAQPVPGPEAFYSPMVGDTVNHVSIVLNRMDSVDCVNSHEDLVCTAGYPFLSDCFGLCYLSMRGLGFSSCVSLGWRFDYGDVLKEKTPLHRLSNPTDRFLFFESI